MQTQDIYQLTDLFTQVQLQQVFPDGKTFPDCLAKFPLDDINQRYQQQKDEPGFNLSQFVHENFMLPPVYNSSYFTDAKQPIKKQAEALWDALTGTPGGETASSLIPLPRPYIVPGGRFNELHYWDSYCIMLGLQASNRVDMMENMVDNFSYLINTLGYIPCGNRNYYKGRSHPPFYALMLQLLREEKGDAVLIEHLPYLQKEYAYWMQGKDKLDDEHIADKHIVSLPGGALLNRYWDEHDTPRPEAYREDVALAHGAEDATALYRHIRAAAESGWGLSSRWFKLPGQPASLHTTDIIPVDLNCLLFYLEQTISEAAMLAGKRQEALRYSILAARRKTAIQEYCWNQAQEFYTDYDFVQQQPKDIITMAGMYPLFFGIATVEQAEKASAVLHTQLLKAGGCVATNETSGQPWDSPNGWAPLQYIAVKGLEKYGMHNLAAEIAKRWVNLVIKVFKSSGTLLDTYNVVDTSLPASGAEYPAKDGFGWTNGVLLKLTDRSGITGMKKEG